MDTIPSFAPVSVVIPAHNAEGELAETIASAREQSLPVGEIIVVDDGSSDRTATIAASMGVTLIRLEQNRGTSGARNAGIRSARFDWVAFLDSDDLWKPEKMATEWALVQRHPELEMVFCDRDHFEGDHTLTSDHLQGLPHYRALPRKPLGEGAVRFRGPEIGGALVSGHFILPSTLLVRKELLLRAGLFDEELLGPHTRRRACEDFELNLRLVHLTDPAAIERSLVRYRIREGSESSQTLGMILGAIFVSDRMEAAPERYPPGTAEQYRLERPGKLLDAALELMRLEEHRAARPLLRRSFREAPRAKAGWLFLLALAGPHLFRALLRVKRALGPRSLLAAKAGSA